MTDGVEIKTVKVRASWAPLFWRHPIDWFRTFGLRRTIRAVQRQPRTDLERELQQRVSAALLGTLSNEQIDQLED